MLSVVDRHAVEYLGREYREERLVVIVVIFVSVMLAVAEEISFIRGTGFFARGRIVGGTRFVEKRSRFGIWSGLLAVSRAQETCEHSDVDC